MKVRECFLHAVSLLPEEADAREVWIAMNRKNAPWAAVLGEADRLLGLLGAAELDGVLRLPEVFITAGELAAKEPASRRALRIPPEAELGEAVLQLEAAGADAALVEAEGRPPGVLELATAKKKLGGE
ncbi:MAG: hypothetical protein V3V56_02460 [bacterium]